MRTRIQMSKAPQPAARPMPLYPVGAAANNPAARALEAAEARAREPVAQDRGLLYHEPPLYERMPDPATIPGLKEMGVIKLPVYVSTKDGMNAAQLDAQMDAARFGVRFRNPETRRKVESFITDPEHVNTQHVSTNLYTLWQPKTNPAGLRTAAAVPALLKMRDMFRPGEAPKRKQIPMRVVVIDSSGKSAPVDVAIPVGRNDHLSHLVQGIRTKLAIPAKEKIVLASVQFKSHEEKRRKPGAQVNGTSKVDVLYTCATDKDGNPVAGATAPAGGKTAADYDRRAVQKIIGFAREVPPDSSVYKDALTRDHLENRSTNSRASKLNDPTQPDDVLVAYRLPETTSDLSLIHISEPTRPY